MSVIIGTSGWRYRDWKQRFYPEAIPQRGVACVLCRPLHDRRVQQRVLPAAGGRTIAVWARWTPADFIMAVKMSRYLTHIKRLRDPAEPVSRFLERAQHLGGKLGPVLLM